MCHIFKLFASDFNETSIFSTIFEKHSIIKFHENRSIESRVFPRGRTNGQTARQKTDIAKQIFAFRNFAKELKNPNITFVIHMKYLSVGRQTLEFILNKCRPC